MAPAMPEERSSTAVKGVNGYDQEHPGRQGAGSDVLHDLVCVGFGPATLAIGIALRDILGSAALPPKLAHLRHVQPTVAFLERQPQFSWHGGMLLPDARMQINFIKDFATSRDPRSEFTFLNYLHQQRRLLQFINVGSFFPLRLEYEDYMRWCAAKFTGVAHYGQDVWDISPESTPQAAGKVEVFIVKSKDVHSGATREWRARRVVIAVGGTPKIPPAFSSAHPAVVHSSRYLKTLPTLLQDREGRHRVAVVGSGQSAAEIYNDLQSRYPNGRTWLIIRGPALKPSDDSPFVNEIFEPGQIDGIYDQPQEIRTAAILSNRDTNYGVVRLDLLEHLYAKAYEQRLRYPDERDWRHRILPSRRITSVETRPDRTSLRLSLESQRQRQDGGPAETLEVDAVVLATGYRRDGHEGLLRGARHLMPAHQEPKSPWTVARDYRVHMDPEKVGHQAGIWLQGCNESTHGLSDTLLSVLAVRGAEMVESLFGRSLTDMDDAHHANAVSQIPQNER